MLIVYILSFIMIMTGAMLVRRTGERLSLIRELVAVYIQVLIVDLFVTLAVNGFLGRASVVYIIVARILIGIVLLFVWFRSGRKSQEYLNDRTDNIVICILALAAMCIGVYRFGAGFDYYRYLNADSCRHLRFCYILAFENAIPVNMPFCHIQIGGVLECLKSYVPAYEGYRLLEMYDTWQLFLSGVVFWSLIRKYVDGRCLAIAGILTTLFFMLGYPLNSMLDGTIYWGTGCILTMYCLIVVRGCVEDSPAKYLIVRAAMANVALVFCYVQFVPAVIAAEIVFFLLHRYGKGNRGELAGINDGERKRNAKWWITTISIVLLAVIIGVLLISKVTSGEDFLGFLINSLSQDGRVYKNLYADFVWMMPFIAAYIGSVIRSKKADIVVLSAAFILLHELIYLMFIVVYHVESYYYFKNYNILYMAAIYMTFAAICQLKAERQMRTYIIVIVVIAAAGLGRNVIINCAQKGVINKGIEDTIDGITTDFDVAPLITKNVNYLLFNESDVDDNMLAVYKAAGTIAAATGNDVPIVTKRWIENEYYYAISGQGTSYLWDRNMTVNDILANGGYEYFVVDNTTEDWAQLDELRSQFEVVYNNEYAALLKQ